MKPGKWVKWLVGVTGVGMFTSFLFVTQKPGGIEPNAVGKAWQAPAQSAGQASANMTRQTGAKVFLHSRAEMAAIAAESTQAQNERARLLAQLSWDNSKDDTVILPAFDQQPSQTLRNSDRRSRRS